MCGRIAQFSPYEVWEAELGVQCVHSGTRRSYNVAPEDSPVVLHKLYDECVTTAECIHWGCKPCRPYPTHSVVNARVDRVATSDYFKPLWRKRQRVIVPVDGWYEWPTIQGIKRPQYISRKDGQCFLAALAYWEPGATVQPDGAGFVIITDDAKGGLTDVHDSRPIVLSGVDALAWIDPELIPRGASILMHRCLPIDAFQWWEVGLAVGSTQSEGKDLIRNVVTA
ncbi:SOS response-associated peptidase [Cupriavidus pinatubonensis]|uniref:Abasic site processing protein n=1 Tax=Cupriavidus pinatubonensis TaxID=248026 RepID=A0ABN7YGP1_9BURK|nr:SOS response-associated protein YedK [Cupriavidus pinatubonensis]